VRRGPAQSGVNHPSAESCGRLDLGNRSTQASRDVSELGKIYSAMSAYGDVRGKRDFVRWRCHVECGRDGEIEDEDAARAG
jgi:hypothetical protein